MPLHDTVDEGRAQARAVLHDALMAALGNVLSETGLSPIAAMKLAAEALGDAYREVADAHSGEGACTCGWRPVREADLAALQAALTRSSRSPGPAGLRDIAVLGHA